jgi:hypothetical protein
MVRHAEALLALDKSKLEQARSATADRRKGLGGFFGARADSGKVSQRFMEPGEMAAPGTPVVKIEDLSLLEVSVFLPEEHYAALCLGRRRCGSMSAASTWALRVAYKSPTVTPKLRTFEVKALVESPPPEVAPGCLAEVVVVLDGRRGLGFPTRGDSAAQRRFGRVFVVESTAPGCCRSRPAAA